MFWENIQLFQVLIGIKYKPVSTRYTLINYASNTLSILAGLTSQTVWPPHAILLSFPEETCNAAVGVHPSSPPFYTASIHMCFHKLCVSLLQKFRIFAPTFLSLTFSLSFFFNLVLVTVLMFSSMISCSYPLPTLHSFFNLGFWRKS